MYRKLGTCCRVHLPRLHLQRRKTKDLEHVTLRPMQQMEIHCLDRNSRRSKKNKYTTCSVASHRTVPHRNHPILLFLPSFPFLPFTSRVMSGRSLYLFLGRSDTGCLIDHAEDTHASTSPQQEVCFARDAPTNNDEYEYESVFARACALALAATLIGCIAFAIMFVSAASRRRATIASGGGTIAARRFSSRHLAEQMV